jgi:hypothetical protein
MAIQCKAAVEAEYASKRDAIIAYPGASLDDDLAKVELLATKVEECVAVLAAREALNARPPSTPAIGAISEAAGQLRRVPALVRDYLAGIKAGLASIDTTVGP